MLPPAYTARETTDVRGMDQCSEQITFYTDMEPLLPNGQPNPDFGTRQFREEILCGPTPGAWHRPVAEIRPISPRSPRDLPAISPRSPRRGRTLPPWPYPYPHNYP